MRKLQATLALLAVGLAVSIALLAARALQGVAFERAARHRAVASRVFDEMERGLSRLLEREESRPFESYEAMSQLESENFVVGHFQFGPRGSLETSTDTLPAIVGPIWRSGREAKESLTESFDDRKQRPEPGVTQRLAPAKKRKDLPAPMAQADAVEQESSPYQVFESLNRGSRSRAERQQKITVVAKAPAARKPAPSAPGDTSRLDRSDTDFAQGDAAFGAEAAGTREERAADVRISKARLVPPARAEAQPQELAMRDAAEAAAAPPQAPSATPGILPSATLAGAGQQPDAAEEIAELDALLGEMAREGPVQVALDPMVGRASGPDHLLLYRTVLVGEQGYRQGLVIDREALGSWLESQVLRSTTSLAEAARFRLFGEGQALEYEAGSDATVYEHRFAEPFDAFSAVLALAPLPSIATARTIYGLVALVIGIATLGLFAVYRMVAVTVQYAERRSNFVSAVSHELKTPLTAIRMYAEMLRDGLTDSEEKRKTYYQTITDESERLSRLINNVLEFSRIERGGGDVRMSVGAIEPVLEEAVQTLRPHAEQAGFSLRLEVDEGLPALRFDRDCVIQLLFNLVDNAMKYAHRAANKEIVIACRRDGARVALSVRDFGPGVARQHLSKVLEPFYRGENEMTRSTSGTGIGLALVKDLAERMEAAASVANARDGGFRVTIEFQPAG